MIRLMHYNWQQEDWPRFKYSLKDMEEQLFVFVESQGRISGLLKALSEEEKAQSAIDLMIAEAIKTSEIEGEFLSRQDVLSSIRNNLGLNHPLEKVRDKRAEGNNRVNKGQWRSSEDPMQVVSGAVGREIVHFEAPPSARVPQEKKNFIAWFNKTAPGERQEIFHAPVRSAIAHLYFETIHPFEDGNGRIGRALSEKVLSQG